MKTATIEKIHKDTPKKIKKKSDEKISPSFKQAVEKLIFLAQKKGSLTYQQIQETLPHGHNSNDDVETAVNLLSEKNIEISNPKMGSQDKATPVLEELQLHRYVAGIGNSPPPP